MYVWVRVFTLRMIVCKRLYIEFSNALKWICIRSISVIYDEIGQGGSSIGYS